MKKFALLLVMAVMAMTASYVHADTRIKPAELPKTAQTFIAKHFPTYKIRKVEKDMGITGAEYGVDFFGGAEIDFDSDGNWKDIKAASRKAIPASVIPSAISKYVATNFKGLSIVEISRERNGYEIDLSNGTELMLTKDAVPLPSYDD